VHEASAALDHDSDGYIFTALSDTIPNNTNWRQYKWKPVHTVDLLLRVRHDPATGVLDTGLHYVDALLPQPATLCDALRDGIDYDGRRVVVDLDATPVYRQLQQEAIECGSCDAVVECKGLFAGPDLFRCLPVRLRPDKPQPNNARTFRDTLLNIREAITIDTLVSVLVQGRAVPHLAPSAKVSS
jgi:hypothetical protein